MKIWRMIVAAVLMGMMAIMVGCGGGSDSGSGGGSVSNSSSGSGVSTSSAAVNATNYTPKIEIRNAQISPSSFTKGSYVDVTSAITVTVNSGPHTIYGQLTAGSGCITSSSGVTGCTAGSSIFQDNVKTIQGAMVQQDMTVTFRAYVPTSVVGSSKNIAIGPVKLCLDSNTTPCSTYDFTIYAN